MTVVIFFETLCDSFVTSVTVLTVVILAVTILSVMTVVSLWRTVVKVMGAIVVSLKGQLLQFNSFDSCDCASDSCYNIDSYDSCAFLTDTCECNNCDSFDSGQS